MSSDDIAWPLVLVRCGTYPLFGYTILSRETPTLYQQTTDSKNETLSPEIKSERSISEIHDVKESPYSGSVWVFRFPSAARSRQMIGQRTTRRCWIMSSKSLRFVQVDQTPEPRIWPRRDRRRSTFNVLLGPSNAAHFRHLLDRKMWPVSRSFLHNRSEIQLRPLRQHFQYRIQVRT
jgi:hypothetical protein